MTIIGLGSAGCNLAEMFESIDDNHVILIDSNIEGDNCISIPILSSPEEYENKIPNMSNELSGCHQDILFIVGGSGKISGSTLKILENLKDKNISIMYIRPDRDNISSNAILQDRITFYVLQEYARSGIFKQIYLIDNTKIDSIIGDTPVIGYYDALNNLIFSACKFITDSHNLNAIIDNSSTPRDISRICTFGIYDLENDIEKTFYEFDFIDDKCYYFVINENTLKSDGKLFKDIKEKMKQKNVNNTKISYKIYSTSNEKSFCYVLSRTRKIQD